MKQCTIKQIPLEILIMIIEMLIFDDALMICNLLKVSKELAFQYHSYCNSKYSELYKHIAVFDKRKLINPHLAKALVKNVKFQSSADAADIVTFAILSKDLGLIRDALNDSKITHDEICNGPLLTASQFGQLDVIKLLV